MSDVVTLPRRSFGETRRRDAWWVQPVAVLLGLSTSTIYNRRSYGGDLPPSYDIGGGRIRFDATELLEPIHEEPGARLYRIRDEAAVSSGASASPDSF